MKTKLHITRDITNTVLIRKIEGVESLRYLPWQYTHKMPYYFMSVDRELVVLGSSENTIIKENSYIDEQHFKRMVDTMKLSSNRLKEMKPVTPISVDEIVEI